MPAAPRHAKPKAPATRYKAPAVAAVALAGVAATFVSLHGGSAAPTSSGSAISAASEDAVFTGGRVTTEARHDIGRAQARSARRVARNHKLAQQRAAQQAAQQAAAQQPSPPPSSPPPDMSGGSDPAHSALGICIRNAEEGGSYAWGPGNGGGAYQFLLSTWETYGGAASQFGVAGPAYQDQIFNNAIAAGGASNWTAYDGC
jgi:Transglycosylase-like domain